MLLVGLFCELGVHGGAVGLLRQPGVHLLLVGLPRQLSLEVADAASQVVDEHAKWKPSLLQAYADIAGDPEDAGRHSWCDVRRTLAHLLANVPLKCRRLRHRVRGVS